MRSMDWILPITLLGAACSSVDAGEEPAPAGDDTTSGAGTTTIPAGAAGSGGTSASPGGGGNATPVVGKGGAGGAPGAAGASGSTGSGGSGVTAAAMGCDPTVQQPGTWKDVTPPGLGLNTGCPGNACSWAGCQTIMLDPMRPSDMYLSCDFRGTYKSTDCGVTWQKVNTGTNGADLDRGRQWSSSLPVDPSRAPGAPPSLYMTLGYGRLGLWKSVNGGRDWTNTWSDNIFAADGVTNISRDVGSDLGLIYSVDETDPSYMVAVLHGYTGSGGNNGIFVTTDGGAKWVVHGAGKFTFHNHSDVFFPIDRTTWMVTHLAQEAGQQADVYRTTDSGATWNVVLPNKFLSNQVGIGMQIYRHGSTFYVPSYQGMHALFKSTDKGATWSEIQLDIGQAFAIVATSKDLYIAGGASLWDHDYKVEHASLTQDTVWTHDPAPKAIQFPTGNTGNIGTSVPGWAVATNDGAHDIIVTSNYIGGAWRYVVP
jgi:hypothetical protein